MAPKRSNLIEVPPAATSSEEEEASSEEEEEEEGSGSSTEGEEEEPKTQSTPLNHKIQPLRKPEPVTPSLGNEESDDSGSESESESESDMATPDTKPIATRPTEETNAKKVRSNKPGASPVRASSSKRPGEVEQDAKEAKRPKKKAGEEGNVMTPAVEEVKKTSEDAKKQLFQRLFSEDDEIALLRGMLDYSAKKGADPCADMNAFYDFVKKSIHTDVTKAQLMDKIRRLKKKFENNAGKGKLGGDRTFSKAHEQNAFELSKKIWGKEGISGKVESSAAKSNGKAKANNKPVVALKAELHSSPDKKVDVGVPMEVDKVPKSSGSSLFDKRFGVSSLEEEVIKNGLDVVDSEKKVALEAKWRKLQMAELELFIERKELVKEHAELMLEFYKSEDK